jgi:hypothetical protein
MTLVTNSEGLWPCASDLSRDKGIALDRRTESCTETVTILLLETLGTIKTESVQAYGLVLDV